MKTLLHRLSHNDNAYSFERLVDEVYDDIIKSIDPLYIVGKSYIHSMDSFLNNMKWRSNGVQTIISKVENDKRYAYNLIHPFNYRPNRLSILKEYNPVQW